MSKFPMDLSKFKKVKTDDRASTFQHEDGHQLTIAHNKLSPKLKVQLDGVPMADGGVAGEDPQSSSIQDTPEQITSDAAQESPQPQQPINQSPGISSNAEIGATQPQAQNPQDPYGLLQAGQGQLAAIAEQKKGAELEAKTTGEVGKQGAETQQNLEENLLNAQEENDVNRDYLGDKRSELQEDINSFHVNPRRVIDNMSTGGKISSAIGLILGGMGSGLTGGPNLAAQFIQNMIDKDVESQKTELGKKENLLSDNYRQAQDIRTAYDTTRAQYLDIASAELKSQAASAQDPMAQARFLQAAGQLDGQAALIHQKNSIYQSAVGGGGQQGQEPAKSLRLQQMAGVITPQQYEQGNKELAQAQEGEKLRKDLIGSFQNLDKKVFAGEYFSPHERESALNAFAGRLAKVSEGRFNLEESKQQISALMPQKLDSETTRKNKLERLNSLIDEQVNTPTLNGLGIKVQSNRGPQEQRRVTKDGRVAIFDQNKKFLRYE